MHTLILFHSIKNLIKILYGKAQSGRGLFYREESNLSIYEIKKGT